MLRGDSTEVVTELRGIASGGTISRARARSAETTRASRYPATASSISGVVVSYAPHW